MISRRQLIGTAGVAAPALAFPAVLKGAAPDAPLATCAQGKLKGTVENGVLVFKGVPYGGPVSGPEHRFRAPPPPESWTGVRDATKLGPVAPQPPGGFFGPGAKIGEDCLVLNVWTPALDGRKRPVMVYQHGGGFLVGSGGAPWQDGGALARQYDVVVVQSNHRLGLMGYLYLGELLGPEYQGNQGLLDLVAALRWVNINISQFGGDPDNVMIFGESGGGGKTASLYAMPAAEPYFHKASIESPIGPGRQTVEGAAATARKVVERLGLSDPKDILTLPLDALIKAQMGNGPNLPPGAVMKDPPKDYQPGIDFWPFIDGAILPMEPFLCSAPAISAKKPLIVGGCKDESVFFYQGDASVFSLDIAGLKSRLTPIFGDSTQAWIDTFRKSRPEATPSQLFIAITTARPWRAYATEIAEAKAKEGIAPVYSYILDYPSPQKVRGTDFAEGSPHASDISMKFDTAPMFGPKDPRRLATAHNMSEMWATFARTGVPAAKGQPEWKPYTLDKREVMILDGECSLESDPESLERQFFETQPDAIREKGL
ncbi:carboxylesterase/lipase family protein [Novosphingobium beihaiensis]|uniref:Carboxylic ester hydrolase n=1 Tax=Novosphingobium beihaiensis TaxID=2930389 RepID=A0ABT0BLB2_9SPHN|nr:carboxylesterase family protein [Novosphingobium beihaiensis]MCJ2185860.1 carboxylesterase family protein [Novosphingobium beihaiensis]